MLDLYMCKTDSDKKEKHIDLTFLAVDEAIYSIYSLQFMSVENMRRSLREQ